MDETAQRIAIAKFLNWDDEDELGWFPDYPRELDAMHKAEKRLDDLPLDVRSLYYDYLCGIVGIERNNFEMVWKVLRSTASQRAEAFLRTMGKWVEDSTVENGEGKV